MRRVVEEVMRALGVVGLAAVLSTAAGAQASETHVFGYVVDLKELARIPGSKDKELLRKVQAAQKDLLHDIDKRLEYGTGPAITAEQALTDIVEGNLRSGHGYEYRCVIEALVEIVGQRLEDTTPRRSLWFNQDFWLDDFKPVMEQLGLSPLGARWDRETLPFGLPDSDPWPAVSYLTAREVSEALAAFRRTDLNRIEKLDEKLFTRKTHATKSDTKIVPVGPPGQARAWEIHTSLYDLKATMKDNLLELRRWLEVAEASRDDSRSIGLVLIFDGDR
jgi:hypothetical protein